MSAPDNMNSEQFKKYRRKQNRKYSGDSGAQCNNCGVRLSEDEVERSPINTPPGFVHKNKAECADLREAAYR